MKTTTFVCGVVACASVADAFVGSMRPMPVRRASVSNVRMAASSEVTVPDLLKQTEQLKILSTASKLGLLSKLEAAGLTLKDVEKLLPLVDEKDLIGLATGLGPDLLKLAPAALGFAPAALPLVASALAIPAELLYVAAFASFGAGAALVTVLPDDSLVGIALETFFAVPLLFVFPAVLGVSGFALSSLKNGALIELLTKPAVAIAAPAAAIVAKATGTPKASKPTKQAAARSSKSGRPSVGGQVEKAAKEVKKAAKEVKKAAPKPVEKPKPMGNLNNLPKAL